MPKVPLGAFSHARHKFKKRVLFCINKDIDIDIDKIDMMDILYAYFQPYNLDERSIPRLGVSLALGSVDHPQVPRCQSRVYFDN